MPLTPEPRYQCYKCKEELVFEVKIGRRDICPNCNAYLHCCFNCRFWDPNVHNQCTENLAEFIRDRAEGNFCSDFHYKGIGEDRGNAVVDAKAKLAALFGAAPIPASEAPRPMTPEEAARAKLEALFKKK